MLVAYFEHFIFFSLDYSIMDFKIYVFNSATFHRASYFLTEKLF